VNGNLIVITGPSGVGKGSLVKKLLAKSSKYALSISATTRKIREGEENGKDYFFISEKDFDHLIQKNGFLEWAQFAGARYGTLRSEVEQKTKLGQRVILEIELAGARQIMKSSPEAAFIFIAPPNLEVLRDRLLQRGTEGPAEITDRIRIAQEEIAAQAEFDIVLINDDLEASFEQLLNYCESL